MLSLQGYYVQVAKKFYTTLLNLCVLVKMRVMLWPVVRAEIVIGNTVLEDFDVFSQYSNSRVCL